MSACETSLKSSSGSLTPCKNHAAPMEEGHGKNGYQRLSTMLRVSGGAVLVVSTITFLFQHWVGLDSLSRYYSFLAFTMVLSAAGWFCGLVLKEGKGARTFLGISLLSVPAHGVQLGALIYSLTLAGHLTVFAEQDEYIRQLVTYQSPSVVAALATLALSVVLLLPVLYSGFSCMARKEARILTATYGVGVLSLLIPSREPFVVALCVLALFFGVAAIDRKRLRAVPSMGTLEGRVARALLYVPPGIFLGRNLLLYPNADVLCAVVSAILAFGFFEVLPAITQSISTKKFFQTCSVFAVYSASAYANEALFFSYQSPFYIPNSYMLLCTVVPASVTLMVLSRRAIGGGATLRRIAGYSLSAVLLLQIFTVGNVLSSFLCTFGGLLLLGVSCVLEEKSICEMGIVCFVVGLLSYVRFAIDALSISPWFSLAVLGTITVLFASYLETYQGSVIERVRELRTRFKNWE
ncbi:MAG: hypothetical protein KDD62_08970 [Bdellovibrionales bacterium]|nr:hypothetical protein [Bdellovibrionales bacterium]